MPIIEPRELASRLPASLRMGTATSSYQIEGATDVDGRGVANWDTFCAKPGTIDDGSSGAGACDHYHRYPADVALMAEMGLDVYRFSVAWPRVVPQGKGAVEQRGLAFYDRLVDELLSAGIEPVPTLYHWDLPQALEDTGGWTNRDTAGRFADYAGIVVDRLGDRVTRWATLNEPWCSSHLGYHSGTHAPGERDAGKAMAAAYNLLRAHHLGDQAIRAAHSDAEVGVVLNVTTVRGDDEEAVRALDAIRNRWWLDGCINGTVPEDALAAWSLVAEPDVRAGDLSGARPDWLGINYYFPDYVTTDPSAEPLPDACVEPARTQPYDGPTTAMGWRMEPEAFRDLLQRVHREWGPIPIAITENGAAFDDDPPVDGRVADPRRTTYLSEHLAALAEAINSGVNVTDYMAWSFMDNFEWSFGYEKRFGIVYVDYETQERTMKDSAHWYAELVDALQSRRS
ncbi:GH1 family beta-glucosidase [Euzebya tangerina]|uniref:GH1 family beta-glucosidase n=1 Tax=Euzebya tangerina TaxID=591198 RepID=UPI000E30FCEC|nr:GH1 family beta-glucosidase [Euzebya tangerina]